VANYGDVVVCRHPVTAAVPAAARGLPVPVINGGDGTGEHPTQTMTDLYTVRALFGRIDGLRLLLLGDLRMRCVRSLLRGLRHYTCTIGYVAGPGHEPPADLLAECAANGQRVVRHPDPREALEHADVVYDSPTVSAAGVVKDGPPPAGFVLDRTLFESLRGGGPVVLHPLPRGPELDTSLDGSRFDGYWRQAANGVRLRMALLTLVLAGRPPVTAAWPRAHDTAGLR
jgi:aspartate carbamoyltransferase catalytic subunit